MKTYQVGDTVIFPERRSLRMALKNCHGKSGVIKEIIGLETPYFQAQVMYVVEVEGTAYEVFPGELQKKPGRKKVDDAT